MTYEERQTRGTDLCRRLSERIASLCPPGIGSWEDVWTIVEPDSAEFLAALALWEATETDAAQSAVRRAYDNVVSAWRGAVTKWLEMEVSMRQKG